ncbi:hypothetical protein LJB99_02265, partial [Deltaproteobacteria bacterium OttesenSCG-928-K17]|nr:hypothetical protein [Deltaproteobacteria bacterium OttesenSCG-928-K17]
MKLGTKIFAGFILTNVIFLALVIVVYMFMRPVQFGSNDLSENVIDLMSQSSTIAYHVGMEAYEVRGFISSHSQETRDAITMHSDAIKKGFELMVENMASPHANTIKVPAVLEPFNQLKTDYDNYHRMVNEMITRQGTLMELQANLVNGHSKFTESLINFLNHEQARLDEDVKYDVDQKEMERRVVRVDHLRDLRDNIDTMILLIVRGVAESNTDHFATATKSLEAGKPLAAELVKGSKSTKSTELSAIMAANLQKLEDDFATLKSTLEASNSAYRDRSVLVNRVVENASSLMKVGSDMALKTATESTAAVNRAIYSMFAGTAVAIIISPL